MKIEEIKECLELLTRAIERVTMNTAVEQGFERAGEVINILDKAKHILGMEPPEVKGCFNCKYCTESFSNNLPCDYCTTTGIRGSTPSRWEREDAE